MDESTGVWVFAMFVILLQMLSQEEFSLVCGCACRYRRAFAVLSAAGH